MGLIFSYFFGSSSDENSHNPVSTNKYPPTKAPIQSSIPSRSETYYAKTSNNIAPDYKACYYGSISPNQNFVHSIYSERTASNAATTYKASVFSYENINSDRLKTSNSLANISKPVSKAPQPEIHTIKPKVSSKTNEKGENRMIYDYKGSYEALNPHQRYHEDSYSDVNTYYSKNTYNDTGRSYRPQNNLKEIDEVDRKKFGYYKCNKCKRTWQSAHSWEGFGQNCQKCGNNVMPYQREDFINSVDNKIDQNKPHLKEKCEKCKEVGDCTKKTHSKSKIRSRRA